MSAANTKGHLPHLPTDPQERKKTPLWSGLVKYFPDALVAVAQLSQKGNDQHNPGQPLHWSRHKSSDHEDTLLRHLWDSGTIDTDGVRHSTKVVWRALALLQLEIEKANNEPKAPHDKLSKIEFDNDAKLQQYAFLDSLKFHNEAKRRLENIRSERSESASKY